MITAIVFTGISKCQSSQSWIFKILFIWKHIYLKSRKTFKNHLSPLGVMSKGLRNPYTYAEASVEGLGWSINHPRILKTRVRKG